MRQMAVGERFQLHMKGNGLEDIARARIDTTTHLPVGLAFVEQSHDTKHFDLLDLTNVAYGFTDLADVQGVVVSLGASLGVGGGGVLPCLGEGSVVPDVTWVSGGPSADEK